MSCSCTSGNPRSFRVQHGWHVRPMKTGGFHGWKAHLKLLLWQGQSLQAWNVRNFMGLLLLSEKMKPKKHHKIHLKKIPHNCKVVRSSKSEGWAMFIPFKIFPPGFSRWHGTTKMHIKCQAIITHASFNDKALRPGGTAMVTLRVKGYKTNVPKTCLSRSTVYREKLADLEERWFVPQLQSIARQSSKRKGNVSSWFKLHSFAIFGWILHGWGSHLREPTWSRRHARTAKGSFWGTRKMEEIAFTTPPHSSRRRIRCAFPQNPGITRPRDQVIWQPTLLLLHHECQKKRLQK